MHRIAAVLLLTTLTLGGCGIAIEHDLQTRSPWSRRGAPAEDLRAVVRAGPPTFRTHKHPPLHLRSGVERQEVEAIGWALAHPWLGWMYGAIAGLILAGSAADGDPLTQSLMVAMGAQSGNDGLARIGGWQGDARSEQSLEPAESIGAAAGAIGVATGQPVIGPVLGAIGAAVFGATRCHGEADWLCEEQTDWLRLATLGALHGRARLGQRSLPLVRRFAGVGCAASVARFAALTTTAEHADVLSAGLC